jgi:competence ComEA-like helix-hairpin-helix protein
MLPSQVEFWTPSQRRGLLVIIAAIALCLTIKLLRNPTTVSDPQPQEGPAASRLASKLDPNTATAAELAAIPELGEKRAQAIVDYREEFSAKHPGQKAYTRATDLERIKGIGLATSENLEAYLKF